MGDIRAKGLSILALALFAAATFTAVSSGTTATAGAQDGPSPSSVLPVPEGPDPRAVASWHEELSPSEADGALGADLMDRASSSRPHPAGVAAIERHPTLPYVFITIPSRNRVLVAWGPTGDLVVDMTVAGQPSQIAFSDDGESVYFTSENAASLMVIDMIHVIREVETPTVTVLSIPGTPLGVAAGADGRLFAHVFENFGEVILEIDPETGRKIGRPIVEYLNLGEMTVSRDKTRLYFADYLHEEVLAFDLTTAEPQQIHQNAPDNSIAGGTDSEISEDGSVLAYAVAEFHPSRGEVRRYQANGLIEAGRWKTNYAPSSIGFSPDGLYLYVGGLAGRIQVFDAQAPYGLLFNLELDEPNGVVIEIVTDVTFQRVYALRADGGISVFDTGTFRDDTFWCGGVPLTVDLELGDVPTAGIDVIGGTIGDDLITTGGGDFHLMCGYEGNDRIVGWTGDDVIFGGDGDDHLDGREGFDLIVGGDGRDRISGGRGHDSLVGGGQIDVIHGDEGNDYIDGEGGSDWLWGGPGADEIYGGSGADRIDGGAGDDFIVGQGGQDRLRGKDGDDTIQGSHQSDEISGGDGDDILRGAAGQDEITGGAGDDELYGGDNSDTLDGGAGADLHHGQRGADTCVRRMDPTDSFISC